MFAEVEQARDLLRSVVSDLEPGCLSGKDAVRLVQRFAEIRRLADAGIALAAKRVDDASAWRDSGQPNAASWLARTTGSTLGSAITALNTAERLEELPATEDAFRKGELSEVQAREVTEAAIVDPSAERRMLEVAGTWSRSPSAPPVVVSAGGHGRRCWPASGRTRRRSDRWNANEAHDRAARDRRRVSAQASSYRARRARANV